MEQRLMKCGHICSGVDEEHLVCPICDISEISDEYINLEGRKARCSMCGGEEESNINLPFFHYNKNFDYDDYYCGCKGWD